MANVRYTAAMLAVVIAVLAGFAPYVTRGDDLKVVQSDVIPGAWKGVGQDPNDPAKRREDTFRVTREGDVYVFRLTGVHGDKPYSFFGNFYDPPIGKAVFEMFYDRLGMVHGAYLRAFRDPCNSRQRFPLSGSITPDHKLIYMTFEIDEWYVDQRNTCRPVGKIKWRFQLRKVD